MNYFDEIKEFYATLAEEAASGLDAVVMHQNISIGDLWN